MGEEATESCLGISISLQRNRSLLADLFPKPEKWRLFLTGKPKERQREGIGFAWAAPHVQVLERLPRSNRRSKAEPGEPREPGLCHKQANIESCTMNNVWILNQKASQKQAEGLLIALIRPKWIGLDLQANPASRIQESRSDLPPAVRFALFQLLWICSGKALSEARARLAPSSHFALESSRRTMLQQE